MYERGTLLLIGLASILGFDWDANPSHPRALRPLHFGLAVREGRYLRIKFGRWKF
jgi:hypothetical protein